MNLDWNSLARAVSDCAAIRRRRRLQPVDGQGGKIFPPTYPGPKKDDPPQHVFERRRIGGQDIWCALVDSVQSQANRLEEALLAASRKREIALPYLFVDFSAANLEGLKEVTSLDAPHRLYDAILRDSLWNDTPFLKSELGKRLIAAKPSDASTILELSPTALVFGAWNSTGDGGGLGAKFPRTLVSEITAVNVPVDHAAATDEVRTAGRRTGSRIDPLGVLRGVEVFKGEAGWDTDAKSAGKGAKKVRPSEINHGNIRPGIVALGITCDYVEQTSVISLAGLRRLHFGDQQRSIAARALLAALGLVALLEQDAQGYALRSRCDLACEGSSPFEIVAFDGTTHPLEIDLGSSRSLYEEAIVQLKNFGFSYSTKPIKLTPQPKLVNIVVKSRDLALAGEGAAAEKDSD